MNPWSENISKRILRIFLFIWSAAVTHPNALLSQGFSEKHSLRLLSATPEALIMENLPGSIGYTTMEAAGNTYTRIRLPGYLNNDRPGMPELPVVHATVEIPHEAGLEVVILGIDSLIIPLTEKGYPHPIYPSQPSLRKDTPQPDRPFYFDSLAYRQNRFTGDNLIRVESIGIMRGSRLARITVSPFRYHPVKHLLVVYTRVKFEIRFIHPNHTLTRNKKKKYYSPLFEPLLKKSLNYEAPAGKTGEQPVAETFVILADSLFRDALAPLVEWKTKKGFRVIEMYKGKPGTGETPEEFKTSLSQLYHNPPAGTAPPGFLLIVGDVDQIPSSAGTGHITDLYYACYDGEGDYLPELFYGRFSANTVDELIPQIEKTLEYEQYLFPDPSFLDEAVMIAGVDNTYASLHGNGQIRYGTSYYINSAHGITSHTYLYPESGSASEAIKSHLRNGVGFVNYTGHGQYDRWENPVFSISDIPSLTNTHRFPLIIGNGCATNRMEHYACLGEALLRAPGKGALGYIGCSNDSYWDEDYYWAVGVGNIVSHPLYEETGPGMYDKVFHEGNESENSWAPAQGQMVFAGNMAVLEGSPRYAKYYWEIYQLMGDPSLMPYFSVPEQLTASFHSQVPVGTSYLNVLTLPGAYAALSSETQLMAAAHAGEDGLAVLRFEPLTQTDTLYLVITAQNHQPLFDTLMVSDPDSVFLSLESWYVRDTSGNSNGIMNPGEDIRLGITLRNLGMEEAAPVHLSLHTADTLISLIDSLDTVPSLPGQTSVTLDTAFRYVVTEKVPREHTVRFQLITTDQKNRVFEHFIDLVVHTPDPFIERILINDSLQGNLNRRIDPGETFELQVQAGNQGPGSLQHPVLNVQPGIDIGLLSAAEVSFDSLGPGETVYASFLMKAAPEMEQGSRTDFAITWGSEYYKTQASFSPLAGIPYEDFETGDLLQFSWQNDPVHPWELTSEQPAEGRFSLQSGDITHGQSTSMELTLYFPEDDTLVFLRRVSSEYHYDFLRVYVDGMMKEEWSGEVPWDEAKIPVTPGLHTLKFTYSKDYNTTNGSDRAWIDRIIFPRAVHRMAGQVTADETTGNGNQTVEAGEQVTVLTILDNPGITGGYPVTARLSAEEPLIILHDSIWEFPETITPENQLLEAKFDIETDPLIPDGYTVPLVITLTDSTRGFWEYFAEMTINAPSLEITEVWWNDSITGNGNGQLDPGEIMDFHVVIRNAGHAGAGQSTFFLETHPEHGTPVTFLTDTAQIPFLAAGSSQTVVFRMEAATGVTDPLIPFLLRHIEQGDTLLGSWYKSLGHPCEDFETAGFDKFPWITEDAAHWMITPDSPAEGRYSANSPTTEHSGKSSLRLVVENRDNGDLLFFRKVSSEQKYDFLEFHLDDILVQQWSGETDWAAVSYPLPGGIHTLTWTYAKDRSVSTGDDRAWIDYVVLPAESKAVHIDLETAGFRYPENDSILGTEERICIGVVNHSSIPLSNIQVSYAVDRSTPVSEIITEPIQPGDTCWHEFTGTIDLSPEGSYELTAAARHPHDWYPENDSCRIILENLSPEYKIPVASLPGLFLFPQPAPDMLHITFTATGSNPVVLLVTDITGRVRITRNMEPVYGKNSHTLYLRTLEPGIYILHYREGSNTQHAVFLKE